MPHSTLACRPGLILKRVQSVQSRTEHVINTQQERAIALFLNDKHRFFQTQPADGNVNL